MTDFDMDLEYPAVMLPGKQLAAMFYVIDAAQGVLDEIDDYGDGDTITVGRLRRALAVLASLRVEAP